MKKAISLLLTLGLVAVLGACGGGETTTPAESPAGGASPAASPSP